ncbi:hypothetical protein E2P81_ATG06062 [Venturia nashicola]|uniref:SH3 domain-containing protein n=1 Tax=Venturia nashicola TaxID=86259 RepID=A0A4Z1NVX1_9PEZI|nr:hypothetical protein E6O75_ATG06205 [Venturia nashicola]TLD29768.1 hypothetical protein E2P81_ATG06062 [Venturia nashicola]
MTRPQIIRADTIDLQRDQTSPTAQDHSRKPANSTTTNNNSISPHQASELRHIKEERNLEEEHLSNAWNQANGLSEEPPSEDEERYASGMSAEQKEREDLAAGQNGARNGARNGEDADMADQEGDGDSGDDDMMDKISSSPSISDGQYFSLLPWPRRGSSLQSPTPSRRSSRQFSLCSDGLDSGASSPFVDTPLHMPLTFSLSPYNTRRNDGQSRPNTPLEEENVLSSPFTQSPPHLPLNYKKPHPQRFAQSARHHHQMVEYFGSDDTVQGGDDDDDDEGFAEATMDDFEEEARDTIGPLISEQSYLTVPGHNNFYGHPELTKSASDIELERNLLPDDDPLLEEDPDDINCIAESMADILDEDDGDDSWETDSETEYSRDSFESALFGDDDDDDDKQSVLFPSDSRFVDSGWGGECLRELEDIDFEFVYALHTFVATVEGQANAQKGDTMVLLDDSNSYWWLVRVVKDSTIGYLPAEHIETPTERLARLNKHRNVDLSQTMLGDTIDKTKNPLKKAMKRRTDKRVTFTAPTYVEPSDYEFSSDDETEDEISPPNAGSRSSEGHNAEDGEQDDITSVAPLNIKQAKHDGSPEKKSSGEEDRRRTITEDLRSSDELFDREFEGKKQSRNGTLRNTDSFFRDESIETRKITLTPNILRDDSSSITSRPSNDRGPSFELIEKELKGDGKPVKAEKVKKEKKPGLLGGLFSRKKEKKSKGGDGDKNGKVSGEMSRESPSMDLDEARASPTEKAVVEKQTRQENNLGRTGSKNKLQKPPPPSSATVGTNSPDDVRQTEPPIQTKPSADPMSTISSLSKPPRVVSPIAESPEEHRRDTPSEPVSKVGILTNIKDKLHSPMDGTKPEKVKRAKTREALDIDSTPEEEAMDPFGDQAESSELLAPPPPGVQKLGAMSSTERLSESPVHITAADATPPETEPPPLVGDSSSTSSADELASLRSSPSPPLVNSAGTDVTSRNMASSPTLSPESHSPTHGEHLELPAVVNRHVQPESQLPPPPTRSPPPQPGTQSPVPLTTMDTQAVATPARNNSTSTVASTLSPTGSNIPPWSDAHLRAYLDDPTDIKDLLLVVHDKSGVVPVGPDHPLMSNLFAEERGKVQEMNSALDKLLGQWLAKKRVPSTVGRKAAVVKKPSITNVGAGI